MPLIPYSADEIRERMGDPSFPLTQEHAAILYDDEAKKSLGDKAKEFGQGVVEGVKQIGSTVGKAGSEIAADPDLLRLGGSLAEGLLRGTADLGSLVGQAGRKVGDVVSEAATDAGREEKIKNLYQRLLARRSTSREPGKTLIPTANPYENVSEAASFVLDPSFLIPVAGPAGKVTGLTSKASRLAAKGAEVAGEGLAKAAAAPRKLVEKAVSSTLGEAAGKEAGKVVNIGELASVPLALGTGGALPTAAATLKSAEIAGKGIEKAGQLAGKLAETEGATLAGKLKRIRSAPENPEWMRSVADATTQAPLGKALVGATSAAGRVVGSGVQGAGIGAGLGLATSEDARELGQATGAGAAIGAGGRAIAAPLEVRSRKLAERAVDIKKIYDEHVADGVNPDWLRENASDDLMLRAAEAKRIFEGRIGVKFVDAATFDKQSPVPGASGHFDGKNLWVVLDPERTRNGEETFLHEFQHAIAASEVGSRPEIRETIKQAVESAFPGESEKAVAALKVQYAERLAKADLSTPEGKAEVAAMVETLDNESAKRSGGDRDMWLYEEVFADRGAQQLLGQSLEPGWVAQKLTNAREFLSSFGIPFKTNGDVDSALFSGRYKDAIYQSPALRKLIREYVADRQAFLTGISKPRGDAPGLPAKKEMVGRHESLPIHENSDPQGRKGNDFFWVGEDGSIHNRTAKEVKQIEDLRAQTVETALAADTRPPLPVGDPDPEVRLRKTISGLIQRTGTKLGDWFYNLASFSTESKANARRFEAAIENGDVQSFWYQAVGTGRGRMYAESVRKLKGNLMVSKRSALPLGFMVSKTGEANVMGKPVKKGGNVLLIALDLSSAERKAYRWQGESKLDALWTGDTVSFLNDLKTYIRNHANGLPGAEGIGEAKRNALNTFVIGDNVTHRDKNPLRSLLRGEDRDGIVRSFRLDRIESVKPAGEQLGAGKYDSKVLNLSPETQDFGGRFAPTEKPLVDIKGSNGIRVVGPSLFSPQTAWHGTPHKVDKFSTDKIGTGEGAQVYGWGLYLAENPKVAQSYQKGLTERDFIRRVRELYDELSSPDEAEAAITSLKPELSEGQTALLEALKNEGWWGFDYPHQAVQAAIREPQNFDPGPAVLAALEKFGNLYKVEFVAEPHEMLDWDAPLSQQPPEIQQKLASILPQIVRDNYEPRGSDLYGDLSRMNAAPIPEDNGWTQITSVMHRGDGVVGNEKAASELLYSLGIKGIKYKDQFSRDNVSVEKARKSVEAWRAMVEKSPHVGHMRDNLLRAEQDLEKALKTTHNFVVFNGDDIRILEENGRPVEQTEAVAQTP